MSRGIWHLSARALLAGVLASQPLLTAQEPTGGEHEEAKPTPTLTPAPPPGTERPTSDGTTLTEAEAKKILEEGNVTPAWWKAAQFMIDTLIKPAEGELNLAPNYKKAQEFAEALTKNRELMVELVSARELPLDRLSSQMRSGAPIQKQAARKEMERRLNDPLAQLIATTFHRRPEIAAGRAQNLLQKKGDPDAMAVEITRLLGTLGGKQRVAALEKLQAIWGNPEEKKKYDEKVLKDLVEALRVSVNLVPNGEGTALQQAFAPLWQEQLKKNERFHQLVATVNGGTPDAAALAKAELMRTHSAADLMDYIGGQLKDGNDAAAVSITKAMASKTTTDDLFLPLSASDTSFGDVLGKNVNLHLGKSDEEIRGALGTLLSAQASTFEKDSIADPVENTSHNGLQLFNWAEPQGGDPRHFIATVKNGANKIEEATGATLPEGTQLAKQPITSSPLAAKPFTAAELAPPAQTPAANPTQLPQDEEALFAPANAPKNAAEINAILVQNCASCHGPQGEKPLTFTGDSLASLKITLPISDKTVDLRGFATRVRDAKGTVDEMKNNPRVASIVKELESWAKAQEEAVAAGTQPTP